MCEVADRSERGQLLVDERGAAAEFAGAPTPEVWIFPFLGRSQFNSRAKMPGQ
jgi:hypothetical protein